MARLDRGECETICAQVRADFRRFRSDEWDRSVILRDRLLAPAVACPDCDVLQRLPAAYTPASGQLVHMLRPRSGEAAVGARAMGRWRWPLRRPIAFVIANTLPLLDLAVVGRSTSTTIAGAAYEMWLHGEIRHRRCWWVFAPWSPWGLTLASVLALLIGRAAHSECRRGSANLMRAMRFLQAWSMLEVLTLGILVALIKIAQTCQRRGRHGSCSLWGRARSPAAGDGAATPCAAAVAPFCDRTKTGRNREPSKRALRALA
jgi:paraquat-inducible protein A